MRDSINQRALAKPAKPRPDFPLFPHATRRWAKKIRGKMHYFGPWDDPDGALAKFVDQRDDLEAGRTPRVSGAGVTVRDLLNRFLDFKRQRADSGEITERTFSDYNRTTDGLAAAFGKTRLLSDLMPDEFEAFPLRKDYPLRGRGERHNFVKLTRNES